MAPRSLDERLTLQTPCQMKWEDMRGDARVRRYRRRDGTVVTGDCRRIWTTERAEALAHLSSVTTVAGAIALRITLLGT
ncbi:hypothetical protein DRW03_33340 [Corallococcus sp. H22C18031201]|nr:hypothetical protein DRW03_33340 [Corallococcus sp. H22C18031201]